MSCLLEEQVKPKNFEHTEMERGFGHGRANYRRQEIDQT
jgi:hypothetical protein